MKRFASFCFFSGLLLVLPGCGRRVTPAAAGVASGTLLLGNFAEPTDLDPQVMYAFTDANIAYSLFEGLTATNEATSRPEPAAAERWEVSPDGLVYTFHLHPDGRWSNGDPVTADDFAFSFRRVLLPAMAIEYSYMLWPIKNAEAFNSGKLTDFSQVGVKVLDPLTLQLTLEHPTPYLPALAAHNSWMPVHRATLEKFGGVDRRGTRWTREGNLVGNGPFMLQQWSPNDRIVVVKNPHYWDAAHVRLNRIEFFPIDNHETEELDFRVGQLHVTNVLSGLPIAKIAVYRARDPAKLRLDPMLNSNFLIFNVTRPPLDNVKVRRALSLAIDREAIARDVLEGTGTPGHAFTPPDCAGYTPRAQVPSDFAAARALLAEAGFPGGQGLPTFEVLSTSDSLGTKVLESIQAMWRRELGVRISLVPVEQKTAFQTMQQLRYSIALSGWVADYADPSTFLNQYVTGGGNNWTGWGNPDYDRMIQAATETADNAERYEDFQKAEAILLAEAPLAPLFYAEQFYLIDPAVHGWKPSLLGFHRYKDIWLAN